MNRERTYLDCNATAPLRPEAREAMLRALDVTGNPSSVHGEGRAARRLIEDAREQVAALVGARPQAVIFTSGATEANAMVAAGRAWQSTVMPLIEHPSIGQPLHQSNGVMIAVGADGVAAIGDELVPYLTNASLQWPVLVTMQLANSETGAIQDVGGLTLLCRMHRPDAFAHSDATQAAGRIAVDFAALGVDAMTISSHKLGGPKGAGALIVCDGTELAPLIGGGGQERRRRAGTENVAAIAGFGAAAVAAQAGLATYGKISTLRGRLEAEVLRLSPEAIIVAHDAPRLANTSCIALAGRAAETLVTALDLAGIAVSAGAACSSGKVAASHVLQAMGLDARIARAAIRVSLGETTTENDIAAFLAAWEQITRVAAQAA